MTSSDGSATAGAPLAEPASAAAKAPASGAAPASATLLPFAPDEVDLAALDRAYRRAVELGHPDGLPVVGYGEISLAFGWPPDRPRVVAKSLPPFADAARYHAYAAVLEEYLGVLRSRDVMPLPTAVRAVVDGRDHRAYVLQPWLPPETIGPAVLAAATRTQGRALLEAIVAAVLRVSDEHVGVDGQVSNWAWRDGRLHYLDVSTPMLRTPDGRDRLDTALYVAAVPWALRRPVDRFVAPRLLAAYHEPRHVVLDAAGNLLRERLPGWIPELLRVANPHLDVPLTVGEVRRFYRGNARTWSTLQALRRADRAWQRRVRRRTYPFLLPERYQR
jgi:hypothetical protein